VDRDDQITSAVARGGSRAAAMIRRSAGVRTAGLYFLSMRATVVRLLVDGDEKEVLTIAIVLRGRCVFLNYFGFANVDSWCRDVVEC